MQPWITDIDFSKSASNLTKQDLKYGIQKGIHILASLLDVNDKLVNPKRNVKNSPAAKLWVGYEKELLVYICDHLNNWIDKGYKSSINMKNFFYLRSLFNPVDFTYVKYKLPLWVTNELIQTHKSMLIQKEIEREKEIRTEYFELVRSWGTGKLKDMKIYLKKQKMFETQLKENKHYRNLWESKNPTKGVTK